MARQSIPSQSEARTIQYANLLGIDYQTNPTEINRRRSPEMVNMISDDGGNPVKRHGYRYLAYTHNKRFLASCYMEGDLYVAYVETNLDTERITLCISKAWVIEDSGYIDVDDLTKVVLAGYSEYMEINVYKMFSFNKSVCVIASVGYPISTWFCHDYSTSKTTRIELDNLMGFEEEAVRYDDIPDRSLIPTINTMLKPNGEIHQLPVGTNLTGATEGVNILQLYRSSEYLITVTEGNDTVFKIPNYEYIADDGEKNNVLVEYKDRDGQWAETTSWHFRNTHNSVYTKNQAYENRVSTYINKAEIIFDILPYAVKSVDGEDKLFYKRGGYPISGDISANPGQTATKDWVEKYSYPEEIVVEVRDNQGNLMRIGTEESTDTPYYSVTHSDRFYSTITINNPSASGVSLVGLKMQGTAAIDEVVSQEPNLRITYVPFNREQTKDIAGNNCETGFFSEQRKKFFAGTAYEVYDARIFAAAGQRTYYSRSGNPLKVDDNFYFDVDGDVVQYAKTSSSLAVISKDSGNNTVYLASGTYNSELGMTVYTIKASNASVGAISSKFSGTLNDEPLFLSHNGLYGLSTNYFSEKYAVLRSGKINRALCAEPNLSEACGVSFNNYFFIAVNGKMYVIDGRHRDTSRNGDSGYECFLFDNIPENITNMFVIDNHMYFSTETHTYTWKNDNTEKGDRYVDTMLVIEDENLAERRKPVAAKWCSVVDGDGAPHLYKTLNKKGTMVTLVPNIQTGCDVTIIKDGNEEYYIGRFDGTVFSLSNMALDAMTKKKIKKYKRIQFVLENNANEPFGIISISKTYTIGNYAKR